MGNLSDEELARRMWGVKVRRADEPWSSGTVGWRQLTSGDEGSALYRVIRSRLDAGYRGGVVSDAGRRFEWMTDQ